jgi:homoserine O-acetyltransferase
MLLFKSSNPVIRRKQAPTSKAADRFFETTVDAMLARAEANDLLYAIESSSDYDPGPGLEKIRAPLLAINFADDLINPLELGILEKEIKRVKNGKAVVMPMSPESVGHGTHTKASVWKHLLRSFLRETDRKRPETKEECRKAEKEIPVFFSLSSCIPYSFFSYL